MTSPAISASIRKRLAILVPVGAVILTGIFASGGQAAGLPDTQPEIEAEMAQKSQEGGGTVVIAPGVVDVVDLHLPSNVTLRGSGALGTPETTLRLKPGTDGQAVRLRSRTTGNALENVILDGNRQNQSADRYVASGSQTVPVARPPALLMDCAGCSARYVTVQNAMYDGVQVSGQNILIDQSRSLTAGRFGFVTTGSAMNVRIYNSEASDTGIAWTYVGGGAGFAGGGKNVEFRNVTTRRTNGDGVAAYASSNEDMQVRDSVFYAPRNHCVHLGGDRPIVAGNRCYDARLNGYFIANDWRPGLEGDRDAVGGRIVSNYAQNVGANGVLVQWYVENTRVLNNRITTTGRNSFAIASSKNVGVSGNVGRLPGRKSCHLYLSTSSRVTQSKNNLDYRGRTRPITC